MSCKTPVFRAVYDSPTLQNVAANGVIALPTVTSNSSCLTSTDGTVTIREAGTYMVSWNATASATAAGPVEIQLFRNGSPVPGSHAIVTAATAANLVAMSATTPISIECCGGDALTLRAVTTTGIRIAAIVVEKVN